MKKRILILGGGISGERSISLKTAKAVKNCIKKKYNCKISFGNHCHNHNVLYMSLCYNPSDILFYVKGSDTLRYPDDKHAIPLEMVHSFINNLINLRKAIGIGNKERMEIKI